MEMGSGARYNPFEAYAESEQEETTETEGEFKVPAEPRASGSSPAAEGAAKDARVHRRVISLQGGNLKMMVTSKPKAHAPFSIDGSMETVSIAANVFDQLELVYQKQREDVVTEDGFISTPLHVLKNMSEDFKMQMHYEIFLLNHPCMTNQIWRVEILIGKVRGIGQSPTKRLSIQVAALDVLLKIKEACTTLRLKPYAFLPGWRTNIKVFADLKKFCFQHNLEFPLFTFLQPLPYAEGPMFGVECKIGDLVETVRSDDRFLAKRLVARQMLDKLSGSKFRDDDVHIGNQCIGLNALKEQGIYTLSSSWKKQWMMENRVIDNILLTPEDEPDDGDFMDLEEMEEYTMPGSSKLPKKGNPSGIIRVVKNEKAAASATETSDMDMDA